MNNSIKLWEDFDESPSGHTEDSDKGTLELRDGRLVLVEERSHSNFINHSKSGSSKHEYEVPVGAFVKWIKASGTKS